MLYDKLVLEKYLNAEYETWKIVHAIRDNVKVEHVIAFFEKKYFSEEMFSVISRPVFMDDEYFEEFSEFIKKKSK